MLIVGVIVGALVMAPVIQILYEAYGIGSVMPRPGMDPAQALGAPKAALMAAVASAVFECSLDWTMFGLGAGLAVLIIIVDEILKARQAAWRLPILGVAIGIYMPLEVTVPIVIGGFLAHFADRRLLKKAVQPAGVAKAQKRGLLFSSGIIAGEALVGIALAVPFAAYQSTECFRIASAGFEPIAVMLGTVVFGYVCYYLYKISSR